MKTFFGLSVVFVALTTQATASVPVLDQQNVFSPSTGLAIDAYYSGAQTFTCGMGGVLSGANVEVMRDPTTTSALVLSLWSVASDGSLLSSLASSSIPASTLPNDYVATLVTFANFSQAVSVTPGEQLAIRLDCNSSDPSARYDWFYQTPGQYSGGRLFEYGNVSMDQAGSDFYFQTYVTPVPEPGCLSLGLLGGLLCLQYARVRRIAAFQGPLRALGLNPQSR